MATRYVWTFVAVLTFCTILCAGSVAAQQADTSGLPETEFYEISTPQGRMVVQLYNETPRHRDNFKRLAAEGFFDGTTFHRVIPRFMIQGGDPNSKDEDPYNDGAGDPGYTLPAEFRPYFFHKKGALAAARTGDQVNPERRSSGSQFYIVQGERFDSLTLNQIEQHIQTAAEKPGYKFSPEARSTYERLGGTPFLDQQYTVFGELVEGFDVLDAITAVPTPKTQGAAAAPEVADRPLAPVTITVRPLPDYVPPASVPR